MRRLPTLLLGIAPATLFLLLALPGEPVPAARSVQPAAEPPTDPMEQVWAAAKGDPRAAKVVNDGIPYRVVNLEFLNKGACEDGRKLYGTPNPPVVHVLCHFDKFAQVMIAARTGAELDAGFAAIRAAKNLVWSEPLVDITPPLPPTGPEQKPLGRDTPEPIVRGGVGDLKGKNVVIAIVDSGVDFRHPDFVRVGQDNKPESRFVAIWDTHRKHVAGTGQPGPIAYPGGVPVGTVFTRADLTADLNGGRKLGDFDLNGHGTACAGVAAGSGAALKQAQGQPGAAKALAGMDYRGVAPEADLIAVRISDVAGRDMPNWWLLNAACDWIDRQAGDRAAVISCSFGGQDGGRDGFGIDERWLTEWLAQRKAGTKGRLVFIAAGNEAEDGLHTSAEFAAGKDARFTWSLTGTKPVTGVIELYLDAVKDTVNGNDVEVRFADGTAAKVLNKYVNSLSKSLVLRIPVESSGSLWLATKGKKTLVADAYLSVYQNRAGDSGGEFTDPGAGNARQVITPGTASGALTIGSYDFNPLFLYPEPRGLQELTDMKVGTISSYSNAGFVRGTKIIKPEIAAPGQRHTAPVPKPLPKHIEDGKRVDLTGQYQRFTGTSAATPYAAGVAALLLQKKPTLTTDELRKLFEAHASRDKKDANPPKVGPVPNPKWGYGKLDEAAVKNLINALP